MSALIPFLQGSGALVIVASAVGALWKYFTKDRKSNKIETVKGWQDTGWTEVKNLRETLDLERVERKRDRAEFERRLDRLENGLIMEVGPLILWVDSLTNELHGVFPVPPGPPPLPQTLRDMVAAVRYQQLQGDNDNG